MLINEIFYSIQGEGNNLGKPSIFIRLAGCNLRCIWCDTKYTWLFSLKSMAVIKNRLNEKEKQILGNQVFDKNQEIKKYTIKEIINRVKGYPGRHIVITGGEPLLQKKELEILITNLYESGYSIEIETNGTILPFHLQIKWSLDIMYNVSPKLSSSFNDTSRCIKPNILREYGNYKTNFKFVVSNMNEVYEVKDLISEHEIRHEQVYLMPQATNQSDLEEKSKWLIEICKTLNFKYSHRLHIQLYGAKRGV